MSYELSILTPQGQCFGGQVESLVAPGLTGSFGVLAHHAPMVSALQLGVVKVAASDGNALFFVIGGGIAEVSADGVTLLADSAEPAANPAEAQARLDLLRGNAQPPPAAAKG